ncbi:uncharacterized protein LOC127086774 isoform X6 [Lathyrus oleraceus]|uniref:uncharacterized protein LOC127086774 isoform X6 n=1 Tax=Pisum sativum TaxID=3888 RepID=UPI0021D289CA|nr:uncharacterized protein LOC127086774 isoform X6 [Pisum sativum]
MRLRKGSKVEVLVNTSRLEVEWHGARITSGNGHTYNVKYDHSSANEKALSRRVPRKAIRPCPPAVKNIEGWKVNDAVEVWNDGCWKKATVLKYMTGELYLVALHGSCTELKVQEIHMRMCQSWENGQWIISPTVPAKSRVMKFSRNLISNNYKVMPDVQQANNVCSLGLDDSCLHLPSPSTLKRVCSHGSSRIQDYPRKKRACVIMGESKRFKAVSTAPLMEKQVLSKMMQIPFAVIQNFQMFKTLMDFMMICWQMLAKVMTIPFAVMQILEMLKTQRDSVGGLHALLPMAKYDARCA